MGARRVLVIARAGDNSLHHQWLAGAPGESRSWDLHISYFGDLSRPFDDRPADVTLSFEKGTKAAGTVACLQKLGAKIDEYDWTWLPDDDLSADLPTLNRFFDLVAKFNLDLAQPALGTGSWAAHPITVQRPHMLLRFTTFVEIMAACFSRKALKICAPYLDATASSWGPDILFPKLLGYPRRAIAIIDETPVIHTRPVARGPNIALAKTSGLTPQEELADFLDRHDLKKRHETWSGIDLGGNLITDQSEIDSEQAICRW
jgi:hypothetical protein